MADDPDTSPKVGAIIPVSDTMHAPFIFYEGAAAFGCANGVINITLAAGRTWVGADKLVNDHVVVAYLRGNIAAALSLRQALDNALLLAAPAPTEGKAN